MKFDPTRKYSKIYGTDPSMPGAKFQQGVYIYDVNHRCINPDVPAPKVDPVAQATESMITVLTQKLEIAMAELQKAQQLADAFQTKGNKMKLTKATNKYESIKSELDSLIA
jgi:hypothetical protein